MSEEHEELTARLGEFVDDGLLPAEHRRVEAHLEECERCLAEVESLLALRAGARALPRDRSPSRDLWPEIAARIQASERPPRDLAAPAARRVIEVDFRARRSPARWWGAAAAAVALVVLSSGLTVRLLRPGGPGPVASAPAPAPAPARPMGLAAFQAGEQEYRSAVEALQADLEARRERLAPETVATIERNLSIIDAAIAEAQAALAADPSNSELPLMLSGVYRQKVELLQRAVQLSART